MMHRGGPSAGGGQVQIGRLRAGLRAQGVDARILCREPADEDAVLIPTRPVPERWLGHLTKRIGLNDIHLIGSAEVPALPEFADADLVDIHCLHSGTFSYLSLPALTAGKPAVFTFHDMWPLTGHCHASVGCDRWKTGCGACPHLDTHPSVRRDATAWEWSLKRWVYGRSKFEIVVPSRWLMERAKESMLKDFPIHFIPHGVDTSVFTPLGKRQCREVLGIPADKHVLLCGMEDMRRPMKGAHLLVEALRELPERLRRECVVLLFGHSSRQVIERIPMPVIDLGYLEDDGRKAIAYSAADLLVHPSRAETFGLVILESMACGTPVVAFEVGGVPELVRPGLTGYLATPDDPSSLSKGISDLLDAPGDRERMAAVCRRSAVNEYPLDLQVRRYLDLYADVIGTSGPFSVSAGYAIT